MIFFFFFNEHFTKIRTSEFIFSVYPRIMLPGNGNRSSPNTRAVVKSPYKRPNGYNATVGP